MHKRVIQLFVDSLIEDRLPLATSIGPEAVAEPTTTTDSPLLALFLFYDPRNHVCQRPGILLALFLGATALAVGASR